MFLCHRKVALEAERVKRELLQQRMEQEKADIIEAVCKQGGLCKTAADVDNLLKEHKTFNSKYKALSVQLRYHKNVLKKSSKLLVKTKLSIQTIRDNFVSYLQTEPGIFDFVPAQLSHPVERVAPSQPPPPPSPPLQSKEFSQGQCVAVSYDVGYFIGKVLEAHRDGTATVTFIDQIPEKNLLRWRNEDIDEVQKKFLFAWDIKLRSSNGRVWHVDDFQKLKEQYLRLFENV